MQKKPLLFPAFAALLLFCALFFQMQRVKKESYLLAGARKKSVQVVFRFRVEKAIVETCRYVLSSEGDESLVDCKVVDR